MKLPIYIYGSPTLREEAVEIDASYPELKKLIVNMFDTMYAAEGVGLAAPQVGRSIRMFVIDARMCADEEPELADFKKVFINPEIYESGPEQELMQEGCLSLPGIKEDVLRPTTIRMRYLDENFEPHQVEYSGYAARVIQHEYDHLEGKVFVDRLAPLRKTLLKSRLASMAKGKFSVSYKSKIEKA